MKPEVVISSETEADIGAIRDVTVSAFKTLEISSHTEQFIEAKKVCPEAVFLPSDYETYSLFSVRMFEILRSFSPDVEEYSIDEAFVNITCLRRSFHGPYEEIARRMQETI